MIKPHLETAKRHCDFCEAIDSLMDQRQQESDVDMLKLHLMIEHGWLPGEPIQP